MQKRRADFYEIVKKAYDKGTSDQEATVEKLLEELKTNLQLIYKR